MRAYLKKGKIKAGGEKNWSLTTVHEDCFLCGKEVIAFLRHALELNGAFGHSVNALLQASSDSVVEL